MPPTDPTPAQALRRALVPLGILAGGHLVLGLCGLEPKWFPESVMLLIALQPVTAALMFWTGRRVAGASLKLGGAVITLSGLYLLVSTLALVGFCAEPMGLMLAGVGMAVAGPIAGAVFFGLVGAAVGQVWRPGRVWLAVLYAALLAAGAIALGGAGLGAGVKPLLFLLPNAPPALFCALALAGLRPRRGERELVQASLPDGVTLLAESLPPRVLHRVPCTVPLGLRVASPGQGVPLNNPVLDHLLSLQTTDAEGTAALLADNEHTVLSLLHRFPDSRLEADAVVFAASSPQLADAGASVQQALDEGAAAAEALAVLLEGEGE